MFPASTQSRANVCRIEQTISDLVNATWPTACDHETFTQCCIHVGPPSATLDQHENNTKATSRVYLARSVVRMFGWATFMCSQTDTNVA